jgi:hypothetical protein
MVHALRLAPLPGESLEQDIGVIMKGFVYAYRYGDGDHVKIGKTNDLNRRRGALQGAHHHPLVLAELLEHHGYQEGERHIHRLLAARRVQGGGTGSREHFLVPDAELADAFEETRRYLDIELPRQRQLPKYEALEAREDILAATPEVLEVWSRSGEVRNTRADRQAELDRLDEEANKAYERVWRRQWSERERLNREIHELDVEEADLQTTIKLAIGPAAGIEGVATWKSVGGRRRFDAEWVKADDPELFETYRTRFDSARFRQEQPAEYDAHMRVTMHREFEWVTEVDPATDKQAFRSHQTERQSGRGRFLGRLRSTIPAQR